MGGRQTRTCEEKAGLAAVCAKLLSTHAGREEKQGKQAWPAERLGAQEKKNSGALGVGFVGSGSWARQACFVGVWSEMGLKLGLKIGYNLGSKMDLKENRSNKIK